MQWQYNQVRLIINDLVARQCLRKDLRKFEKQLYSEGMFKKTLSKVYNQLLLNKDAADFSRVKWQIETQSEISQQE